MSKIKNQRVLEIHIEKARDYALRLFAFTSTTFPEEWSRQWNEIITPDLIEFAFHARKVNEICRFNQNNFPNINSLIVKISANDPGNWEVNYQYALNAFVHMDSFVIGQSHSDHRVIFQKAKSNLITTYVKIKTDQRPEKTISIFGLAFCFLNSVIPLIREKYPDIKF